MGLPMTKGALAYGGGRNRAKENPGFRRGALLVGQIDDEEDGPKKGKEVVHHFFTRGMGRLTGVL